MAGGHGWGGAKGSAREGSPARESPRVEGVKQVQVWRPPDDPCDSDPGTRRPPLLVPSSRRGLSCAAISAQCTEWCRGARVIRTARSPRRGESRAVIAPFAGRARAHAGYVYTCDRRSRVVPTPRARAAQRLQRSVPGPLDGGSLGEMSGESHFQTTTASRSTPIVCSKPFSSSVIVSLFFATVLKRFRQERNAQLSHTYRSSFIVIALYARAHICYAYIYTPNVRARINTSRSSCSRTTECCCACDARIHVTQSCAILLLVLFRRIVIARIHIVVLYATHYFISFSLSLSSF